MHASPSILCFSRRPRAWFVWLALAAAVALPTLARAQNAKEYQVKAAFLYNFTKFVEWAPERFADRARPIVIGLVGPNPFGNELTKIVAGRKANGRDIVVKQLASAAEAGAVHVVFVGAGEDAAMRSALAALRAAGVLTVSESPHFKAIGGMITFVRESDKVRFEINQHASEQAGLKISAQLLKLATLVHRKSPASP